MARSTTAEATECPVCKKPFAPKDAARELVESPGDFCWGEHQTEPDGQEAVELEQVPERRRMPRISPGKVTSFTVGNVGGYLTVGEFEDGSLGKIFLKLTRQGVLVGGILDAVAISVSLGLQHGVPLEAYVRKFIKMRSEPSGMTSDPEVRFAASILDYVFRRLALDYLPLEVRYELNISTLEERNRSLDEQQNDRRPMPVDDVDYRAPMCFQCGVTMNRAGSAHVCPQCGTLSGSAA